MIRPSFLSRWSRIVVANHAVVRPPALEQVAASSLQFRIQQQRVDGRSDRIRGGAPGWRPFLGSGRSSRTAYGRNAISDLLLDMRWQASTIASCPDAKLAGPEDLGSRGGDAHSRGAPADLLAEILLVLARLLRELLQDAGVETDCRHYQLAQAHTFFRFNALDTLLTRPLSTPRNRATLMRLASTTQAWRATKFTRRSSIRPSFLTILSFTSSGLLPLSHCSLLCAFCSS